MKKHSRRAFAKKHIDKRLILNLRIFLLIFVIMLGVIFYDVFQNIISFTLAIGGILLGTLIGFLLGRVFAISWHEEKSKVVSRLDMLGVVILLVYIGFAVSRNWIFGYFIHGPMLTAFSFSLLAGSMLGRFISMGLNIRKVLYSRGIFS